MLSWKTLIPGCFGNNDLVFATHPNDQDRAKAMFHIAMVSHATLNDIISEVKVYLESQNASPQHIEKQIKCIKNSRLNPQNKNKMNSAWLVTWENDNTITTSNIIHNFGDNTKIVLIGNSRTSPDTIKNKMENHFMDEYPLIAKMTYARNKKYNPHSATHHKINSIFWHDRIICGNQPCLYGRKVRNLELSNNDENKEILKWEELPIPHISFNKDGK